MARGHEAHQQRQMELTAFGKELARRAKSRCELSGTSGVPLHVYEIPPAPNQPDISRCLMLCEDVLDQIKQPSKLIPSQWHCLNELIWSDLPAVQTMAHRILTHIAKTQTWAQDILDEAYLDEKIIAASNKEPLG